MLSKTPTKKKSSLGRFIKSLVKGAAIVFFILFTSASMAGIASTSKAPSDGPLPKVTQTRNQHGEISAVREKIR